MELPFFTPEQKLAAKDDPIMLDLETMGVGSYACIIAIGAVKFDPQEMTITDVFYEVIDQQSSVDLGLIVDQSTVNWWAKQPTEARAAFNEPGKPIIGTLAKMADSFFTKDSVVWGNGVDFDNVIMNNAYELAKIPRPWAYYNNRCYRTMKNQFPHIKLNRVGTHHNAVDDSVSQAKHLMKILKEMREHANSHKLRLEGH